VAKLRHLAELAGVVKEILKGRVGVEGTEVVLGDLERLIHALFDGDRRYHNYKLGEAVAAIHSKMVRRYT